MKSFYIQKDNNGGLNISIPLALLMALITMLGLLLPAVMAYGSLNEKVQKLEKDYDLLGERGIETIKNLETRIISLEKTVSGNKVYLTSFQDDLSEIKDELKEVRRSLEKHASD